LGLEATLALHKLKHLKNQTLLYQNSQEKIIATKAKNAAPSIAVGIRENSFLAEPYLDVTRFFDFIIALIFLMVLLPVFLIITILIKISSKGPIIFVQQRVGKNDSDFLLYKFRTMYVQTIESRTLTVGNKDSRITKVGYLLRKYKLDELPQLFNVLKNDMSFVGPRPELRKYVNYYNNTQREILFIKPGITDYASIEFRNENELLAAQTDFEKYYIETVMPLKIRLNEKYKNNKNLKSYFIILIKTFIAIFQ
jgi:lipopolysaccharide/colanic/teichoic acid biosynthesis glycosyltransferase